MGALHAWHLVGTQKCLKGTIQPKWYWWANLTAQHGSGHMALLLTFSPVPTHPPSSLLPLVPGGYVADTFSRLAYRTRPLHCLHTPGAIGLRQCGGHTGPRGCPPPYPCLPLRLQALPIWLSPLCGGHGFGSALLPATGAGPGPRPRAGQSQGEGKESRGRVGVGE